MWRVELIHPLLVHFPLALLVTGTLLWLAGQGLRRRARLAFLLPAGRLLLVLGTALAWVSVYTGELADGVVARTLCDPTVVKAHENNAYTVSAVFSVAMAVDLVVALRPWSRIVRRIAALAVGVALVAGSAGIAYVGHLGAQAVYQQAAGVFTPTESCTEFE